MRAGLVCGERASCDRNFCDVFGIPLVRRALSVRGGTATRVERRGWGHSRIYVLRVVRPHPIDALRMLPLPVGWTRACVCECEILNDILL